MNFDKSLIDTSKKTNTIFIDMVGIGEPLPTDKFKVLKKQAEEDRFGSTRISTMVDITGVEDHKLHTMCRNLVSNLKQLLHGSYEITVVGDKVEVMHVLIPETVGSVSAEVSIGHKSKKVKIHLKLY